MPLREILPNDLVREGYEFYGYMYTVDGQTRFCIGQLNSVPNVQTLRLDAVWIDKNNSVTASLGDKLLPPDAKGGMIFYGWATADRGANAKIFTNGIVDIETSTPLTLYALYTADKAEEVPQSFGAGFLNFLNKLTSGINGVLVLYAVLIFVFIAVILIKKNRRLAYLPLLNVRLAGAEYKAAMRNCGLYPQSRKYGQTKHLSQTGPLRHCRLDPQSLNRKKRRFSWKFTPVISCLLIVVLAFTCCYTAIFSLKQTVDSNNQKAAIQRQIQEYNEQIELEQKALKAEKEARDNYINQASALYAVPLDGSNDEDISDEEAFLYSLVFLDLLSYDYDIFLAYATRSDGSVTKGFAYTDYSEDNYTYKDEDIANYKAGFIDLLDEKSSQAQLEKGAIISPIEIENGQELYNETYNYGYKFVLSLETQFCEAHYIAYSKYVRYQIREFGIEIKDNINVDDGNIIYDNESLLTQVVGIGYLYNYDLNRAVYDPDLGNAFNKDGYSITAGLDYEALLEAYRIPINLQNQKAVTMDSMTITAVSIEAINEYMLHGQREEFLGLSAEQIYLIESQLDSTTFYYVDGVTGAIGTLDVASVLEIIKQTQGTVWDTVWKAVSFALSVISIVVGVVLCFTPAAALGVGLIIGGVIGLTAQYFQEEIANFIVGLLGQDGAKVAGGGMTIIMGGLTINVGTKLIGKAGWVGTAAGVMLIIIGAVLMAFGLSEITEVAFDYNFIKEWTGISDLAYSNLLKGLTYIATIAVVVYNTVKTYYKLVDKANYAKAMEAARKAVDQADDVYGGVSQKLIDEAAAAGDFNKVNELLNQRASNISSEVNKLFPEKSAMWRGQEVHRRMQYTTGAVKEQYLGEFGRTDVLDKAYNYVAELKPNTAWSIAKGWSKLPDYVAGGIRYGYLDSTREIIQLLIKYRVGG